MRTKVAILSLGALPVVLIFAAVGTHLPSHAVAGVPSAVTCPYLVDLKQLKVEVSEVLFVDLIRGIDGNQMKLPDDERDKFRYALVTVRVTKPAGMRLTVAAADLTLHYYHAEDTDVAPCEGLSSFTKALDVDRPIKLPRMAGPGWIKQTTGARATQATEVYFDAVFAKLEHDTKQVWLCIGQPVTVKPFEAKGWTKPE